MKLSSVIKFFKNFADSAENEKALAEYYRVEYRNYPIEECKGTSFKKIKVQDRWGNHWYEDRRLDNLYHERYRR